MFAVNEPQIRLLKEEFPTLSGISDTDIERYFELRSIGKLSEALTLYNTRLKKKYPDDVQREKLMRYYRSHDPRFALLLQDNIKTLADRLVARTQYIINLLTKDIETIDMNDAYSVIKLAEGLLSIISPDRFTAIAFCEKQLRLARILNFNQSKMEKTAELIRLYVTDTLESVQEFKKETESKRKKIESQKMLLKRPAGLDLSKISFSDHDLRMIQIPQAITRIEDKVVAYCLKYWSLTRDPAFEKTIFLFSKKYHTNHSDIYLAIKNGRDHGWKDEEILNAVLSNIVHGYYYSITGDVYLQKTWARYKADGLCDSNTIDAPSIQSELPTLSKKETFLKKKKRHQSRLKIQPAKEFHDSVQEKTRKSPAKVSSRQTQISKIKTMKPFVPTFKDDPAVARQQAIFSPNSITDIIKKLTGKTYTVYKDLFFLKIRPSIRFILSTSSKKKESLFGTRQNEAEELIYQFMFQNFNNPYQNWNESEERKKIETLGYTLPDIEIIISHWIQTGKK